MKAIRFSALGDADVLHLDEVPDPVAGEGEIVLRVRAVGVNFADTLFRRGQYFVRAVFPQIPGMECAGEVESVGSGVTGWSVGDRAMALAMSSYAERVVCKPHDLYPMPPGLGFDEAASLPVQGLTAHHVLSMMGRLAKGERVLVHAAAGGVGTLAVQIARRLGAGQVIGTASGDKKALVLSLGADACVDSRAEDWDAHVTAATGGAGVDVILEMVGGTEHYKKNLALLAPLGRMVVFGAAGGQTHGTIEPVGLMTKNVSVIGYYVTPLLRRRELCAPPLDAIARDVVAGHVKVIVGRRYPLAEAAEAHRAMEGRGTTGKIVLVP